MARRKINAPDRTLLIGDNLEMLENIDSESVDLIYLNPPDNTGMTREATRGTEAEGVSYDETWTFEDMQEDLIVRIALHNSYAVDVINAARLIRGGSMAGYLTFMAVRLVEMRRVMRPGGSIYLHCGPRTSHWLRVLMDAVFGQENFKNEITWQRRAEYEGGRRWMWAHDTLLFYTGPTAHRWTWVQTDHLVGHYERNYRHRDERGRFQLLALTRKGLRKGARSAPWRSFDPATIGKHWIIPPKWVRRFLPEGCDPEGLSVQEKLDLFDAHGVIHQPTASSEPRYKIYEGTEDGALISDVVTDIGRIEADDVERTGWPGQVPIALLERIIRASSNPGDIVLDSFCGSGTACVAAERLGRRWIGIERAQRAGEILQNRLRREAEAVPFHLGSVPLLPNYYVVRVFGRDIVRELVEAQGGVCADCGRQLDDTELMLDVVKSFENLGPSSPVNFHVLCLLCVNITSIGRDAMRERSRRRRTDTVEEPYVRS